MSFYIKDAQLSPKACIIWMHGLGSSGKDMGGLADQFLSQSVRHVFMDAPVRPITINQGMRMRAWYDIVGAALTDREDHAGILESESAIREAIKSQIEDGFSSHQIFLAGFSQGGAMALFTGIRTEHTLAGVIALSSYLPLVRECNAQLDKKTPIFVAKGLFDPIVKPDWTAQSVTWLQSNGYLNVSDHAYPMEHSVCLEEVRDLSSWITTQISLIRINQKGVV